MTQINTAQAVYLGGTAVDAVYLGATKVWPPGGDNPVDLTVTLAIYDSAVPSVKPTIGWITTPEFYQVFTSTNGGGWVFRHQIAPDDFYVFNTTFDSTVQARVDAYNGTTLLETAYSNVLTVGPEPPPATIQKVWTGTASTCASYNGDLERRTDDNAAENAYYGYYDSTLGSQRCHARWDIPSEIRNCVSVDKVELKWWNRLASTAQPDRVAFVAHRDEQLGAYSNSLGAIFNSTGVQRREDTESGGWISGSEWMDFSYTYAARYGRNVDEEIRSYNMQGFGLIPFDSGNAGYGYASKEPQLRITYTILAPPIAP